MSECLRTEVVTNVQGKQRRFRWKLYSVAIVAKSKSTLKL